MKKVTLPLYLVFALAAVIVLVGYAIALPMACKELEMAIPVVGIHVLRAKFRYTRLRCRLFNAELKKTKAVKPIDLRYGLFWQIRMALLPDYFKLVVLRTFDAILIVDFFKCFKAKENTNVCFIVENMIL